jgi:hypothetical protein
LNGTDQQDTRIDKTNHITSVGLLELCEHGGRLRSRESSLRTTKRKQQLGGSPFNTGLIRVRDRAIQKSFCRQF